MAGITLTDSVGRECASAWKFRKTWFARHVTDDALRVKLMTPPSIILNTAVIKNPVAPDRITIARQAGFDGMAMPTEETYHGARAASALSDAIDSTGRSGNANMH